MRTFLKRLWLWAGRIVTALMSLFAAMLFSSRKVATQIRMLAQEVDVERKAFVLGNGASLKQVLNIPKLYEELTHSDVVVTNRFALSSDFKKLCPRYYVLLDPLFFSEEQTKKDSSIMTMYEVLNDVDWQMVLFVPKGAKFEFVNRYIVNSHIKVMRFNATTIIGPVWFQNWMYDNGMGLPSSRNVIIPAIMVMVCMGYKQIYLYGAEFSWTKNIDVDPRNNKVFLNDGHFYQKDNVKYYEKGWYRWYLDSIVQMLYGTEQIAHYAKSRDIKIFNRTKGSFIDAFEYENIDMLIHKQGELKYD